MKDVEELKGYLFIRDLWMQGTGGIHNMRIVNTYSPSYQSQKPDKLLETAEKEKKRKYLEA